MLGDGGTNRTKTVRSIDFFGTVTGIDLFLLLLARLVGAMVKKNKTALLFLSLALVCSLNFLVGSKYHDVWPSPGFIRYSATHWCVCVSVCVCASCLHRTALQSVASNCMQVNKIGAACGNLTKMTHLGGQRVKRQSSCLLILNEFVKKHRKGIHNA